MSEIILNVGDQLVLAKADLKSPHKLLEKGVFQKHPEKNAPFSHTKKWVMEEPENGRINENSNLL